MKRYLPGIIGLLLIVSGIILENVMPGTVKKVYRQYYTAKVQKEFSKKEKIAATYLEIFKGNDLNFFTSKIDELLDIASSDHIFFYYFENAELKLWTSNKVIPDDAYTHEKDELRVKLGNGYYYEMKVANGTTLVVALIPLQNNYPVENRYLKNILSLFSNNTNSCLCFQKDNDLSSPIINRSGDQAFKITFLNQDKAFDWLGFLYILGALLFFSSLSRFVFTLLRNKNTGWALSIITATVVFTVLGWKVFHFPSSIFDNDLFNPVIYGFSVLFSSFGDVLIFSLLLFWISGFVNARKINLSNRQNLALPLFIVLIFTSALLSVFLFMIIRSLVIDSKIVVNMQDLFQMNVYSFLDFGVMLMLTFIFIRFIYLVTVINKNIRLVYFVPLYLLSAAIVYVIPLNVEMNKVFPLVFCCLIWLVFILLSGKEKILLRHIFLIILICSAFIAYEISDSNKVKDEANMRHMTGAIVTNRDQEGEKLLRKTVKSIQNDSYISSYFSNPLISKSLLKKRIEQLYFKGYFIKYNIELQSYDETGFPFKSNTLIKLAYYSGLTKDAEKLTTNPSVYYILTYDGAPYYIIELLIGDATGKKGILIIELKQKAFFEQSVYPELLIKIDEIKSSFRKDYSYAIYNDNVLINQSGDFSYPLVLEPGLYTTGKYTDFGKEGYDHLVYKMNDNVTIFVSKKIESYFYRFSLFSFLFIVASILSLFFYAVFYDPGIFRIGRFKALLKWVKPPWAMTFKTKVQVTILGAIIIALGVTTVLSLKFSRKFSEDNVYRELSSEINSITDRISTFFSNNSFILNSETQGELRILIDELAAISKTDINIFDTDGNLVISSQMPVYEQKIISRKMDAEAFYKLRLKQTSHLIQIEKIGGNIKYLSAYSLIRNKENLIHYFVNIPYLAKEREIEKELASMINTLVDLYLFLFLALSFISIAISNTFIRPLELITSHLRDVRFGPANKPIEWSGRDELGKLIKEYNKMIVAVEKSAEKLAQTERETAWKEMAKQVAHEIKNPLTPMKLSLQQLLRAWDDKSADMDERMKKTVNVLMNRIDNLNQIASEFSRFARLPLPENKEMELESVLDEIVALFANSKTVEIVNIPDTSNTIILGDEGLLSRVFNNLIKNAIQAIPENRKGRIVVSSFYKGDEIIVKISDNGKGIDPGLNDKIFTPNFSTKTSGMGLGLAIVKRIIDNSNGKIWFETRLGEGTDFYISFKVVEAGGDNARKI